MSQRIYLSVLIANFASYIFRFFFLTEKCKLHSLLLYSQATAVHKLINFRGTIAAINHPLQRLNNGSLFVVEDSSFVNIRTSANYTRQKFC